MGDVSKWGLSLSITIYGLLHFITYFYENTFLLGVLSLAGAGILLFSTIIFSVKKLKLPLGLVVVGFFVLFIADTPFLSGVQHGLLQMRNVIGLLIIVPLISWVLREEPYMEAIVGYGNNLLNTSRRFYLGVISFTQ